MKQPIKPTVAVPGEFESSGPDRTRAFFYAGLLLLAFFIAIDMLHGSHFTLFHFKEQDRPVLVAAIALLLALHWGRPTLRARFAPPGARGLIGVLVGIALLLWGMTYWLMSDFGVSYDEVMVWFDALVYGEGRLATPFPAEWRAYTLSLVPAFLLNSDHPQGLVSAYLPVNALIRLAFDTVLAGSLANPLLYLIGGVALVDIARRQFPGDRGTVAVVVLLYALSMQAWTAAMTPYAMTGHLALNLVWLAAFLRGGRWHILAIAAGALATGLHQLVFHPLFVAPFLLQRLLRGEWKLVGGYALAYAAICAWWIAFPMLASQYTGTASVAGASQSDFFRDRLLPLLLVRDPLTLQLMAMNLLRFFAWQHLALLPLVLLAMPAVVRGEELARPLLGGILLVITVMGFILPYQGHGWGYRYLHGWIGSFALLGGMGYRSLRAREPGFALAAFAATTAATLLAMVWLTTRVDAFVAPHVALERRLAGIAADMVIVETEPAHTTRDGKWAANAIDLVRNRPHLTNRPLRFSSQLMTPASAAALCARGTIALVDRDAQRAVGFSLNQPGPSRRFMALRARLEAEARAGRCRIVRPVS